MTAPGEDVPAPPPAAVAAEFAVLTRRLGIEVPADLADGVLLGYRALREMTALVRRAGPPGGSGPGSAPGSAPGNGGPGPEWSDG